MGAGDYCCSSMSSRSDLERGAGEQEPRHRHKMVDGRRQHGGPSESHSAEDLPRRHETRRTAPDVSLRAKQSWFSTKAKKQERLQELQLDCGDTDGSEFLQSLWERTDTEVNSLHSVQGRCFFFYFLHPVICLHHI